MAQDEDKGFEDRLSNVWDTRLMCQDRGALLRGAVGVMRSWRKGTEALLCQSSLEQVYGKNLLQREFHSGKEMAMLGHDGS